MKKILLIFTLIVSGYVFSEERTWTEFSIKNRPYEICSNYDLFLLVSCVNEYFKNGFKAQSGVHAIQTPKGTLFFQSVIKK